MTVITIDPAPRYFKVSSPAEYVAHVEINRPEKLNAFHPPMRTELRQIFNQLSVHPELRVVLLSGAGEKAFTAGLDVQEASSSGSIKPDDGPVDPSRKATAIRRTIYDFQDVVSSIARCEKPVIALMHGYSYGLAIDLSSACDIRLATKDVKFSVKEVDIGLAADVGTLSRFPKVIGGLTSWVKEVALSARPFGAEEAEKNGFISRSCANKAELIQEGVKLASYIASKSPVAVQGTKNILDAAWGRTVEDNLTYTAIWNQAMIQSDDMKRAMLSGLQKRTPKFEKL